MLTPLRDVLVEAREAGRAVAAFNVIHLEHAEALTGAAEQVGLPVVLQISENTVTFHGSLAPPGRRDAGPCGAGVGPGRPPPRPRGE